MKEFDIVCVAQPSWNGPYAKSTVLLMKQIALRNRVLYVDYAFTWKDLFLSIFGKLDVPVLKMLGLKDRLRISIVKNNEIRLAVLTLPPMLPLNFLPPGLLYKAFNSFNSWLAGFSIRKAARRIRFQKPVVINAFAPSLGLGLLHKLNEKLTIYYCYDEIKEAAWSGKHGGKMEQEFVEKSNAIIVSSDSLCKEKSILNKNIFVVKNGVDTNLFKTNGYVTAAKSKPVVIGFVGSLDNRIDYELLTEVIQNSPELHFRFIGRIVDLRFKELEKFSNVEWISPVSYNHLPALIQDFDIGIIPFVRSAFTEKIYPLKINEYLAMGKPVVMTSFALLPEFDLVTMRADSPDEFRRALISGIETDSVAKINQRIAFAQNNSWEERSKELNEILELMSSEK